MLNCYFSLILKAVYECVISTGWISRFCFSFSLLNFNLISKKCRSQDCIADRQSCICRAEGSLFGSRRKAPYHLHLGQYLLN
jgi:hypothetical protein